jgi:hypothetical protein
VSQCETFSSERPVGVRLGPYVPISKQEAAMAFEVIARGGPGEGTSSHETAKDAYEHAVRLLGEGLSYVAIRDEEGKECSTGDFSERYLDPMGKPSGSRS